MKQVIRVAIVFVVAILVMSLAVSVVSADPPIKRWMTHVNQGNGDKEPSWGPKCKPVSAWNGHEHHEGDTLGERCDVEPTLVPPTDAPQATPTSEPQATATSVPQATNTPPPAATHTPQPVNPTATPVQFSPTATPKPQLPNVTPIPIDSSVTKTPPQVGCSPVISVVYVIVERTVYITSGKAQAAPVEDGASGGPKGRWSF